MRKGFSDEISEYILRITWWIHHFSRIVFIKQSDHLIVCLAWKFSYFLIEFFSHFGELKPQSGSVCSEGTRLHHTWAVKRSRSCWASILARLVQVKHLIVCQLWQSKVGGGEITHSNKPSRVLHRSYRYIWRMRLISLLGVLQVLDDKPLYSGFVVQHLHELLI